ncbi:MAG: OadG family protein [Lachnospiraceae bacterium]|nr:OadG family protein [Lachnospiraceae bacterium]
MQLVSLTSTTIQGEMLGLGDAFLKAILGYAVVFIGLILLMVVIIIVGKIMVASTKRKAAAEEKAAPVETVKAAPEAPKKTAPGSAGECKLYDTDPKVAAMIMAIVADQMGKPLNELRFKSIKEVK